MYKNFMEKLVKFLFSSLLNKILIFVYRLSYNSSLTEPSCLIFSNTSGKGIGKNKLSFSYSHEQLCGKNKVNNMKHSPSNFTFWFLYSQFSQFFNTFYLLVGMSQFIPQLRIGPLFTYIVPLAFVLSLSFITEAIDEYKRYRRDVQINNRLYEVVELDSYNQITYKIKKAQDIEVGEILRLHTKETVPCDCIILKCFTKNGIIFVRTDQLDGETDWKIKQAIGITNKLPIEEWIKIRGNIELEPPRNDIYNFNAKLQVTYEHEIVEYITLDHVLWGNIVLNSGPVLVVAAYTGINMRCKLYNKPPKQELLKFYQEINDVTKLLCATVLFVSFMLILPRPLSYRTLIYFLRFILLLSSIIPISLKVNLDIAKYVYSFFIQKDNELQGCIVRNSAINEELGRVNLLLSDKTGTLTQNNMVLICLLCNKNTIDCRRTQIRLDRNKNDSLIIDSDTNENKTKNLIFCISVCHSVVPTINNETQQLLYQASSPDEMSFVQWCSRNGIELIERNYHKIILNYTNNSSPPFKKNIAILNCFEFDSARKRMSMIIEDPVSLRKYYIVKGADNVILPNLKVNSQWLREALEIQSRQGYRTLVYAYKELDNELYSEFLNQYNDCISNFTIRTTKSYSILDKYLDNNLEVLGATVIEDVLQENVPQTIESLIQAGIKIWVITGDKTDTAISIATSAGLKRTIDTFFEFTIDNCADVDTFIYRTKKLAYLRTNNVIICLDNFVVDYILQIIQIKSNTNYYFKALFKFFELCFNKRSVLFTRCSPSQKADIALVVTKLMPEIRVAAIGDGGNDVPLIKNVHCGIGIEGKEGKQASMAADVSVVKFSQLSPLLLYHGRLAQFRSHKLTKFIIHRGFVIGIIQIYFSSIFHFTPISVFQDWLLVGYTTYYTMLAGFSLILSEDIKRETVYTFPELYICDVNDDLRIINSLFFTKILLVSIYQGSAIVLLTIALFDEQLIHFISIAFTSLVLSELLNICSEIVRWNIYNFCALFISSLTYLTSTFFLPKYFDIEFMLSVEFCYKVVIITLTAWLPIQIYKSIYQIFKPSRYRKLQFYNH